MGPNPTERTRGWLDSACRVYKYPSAPCKFPQHFFKIILTKIVSGPSFFSSLSEKDKNGNFSGKLVSNYGGVDNIGYVGTFCSLSPQGLVAPPDGQFSATSTTVNGLPPTLSSPEILSVTSHIYLRFFFFFLDLNLIFLHVYSVCVQQPVSQREASDPP